MKLAGSFLFYCLALAHKAVPISVLAITVGIYEVVQRHQISFAIALYYTLSIAITSLSNPWDGWYQWFYRFGHGMVAVVRVWKENESVRPVRGILIERTSHASMDQRDSNRT